MPGGRPVTLTAAARAALDGATVDGNAVLLTQRIAAPAWAATKQVLETAGGTYIPRKSGWLFPGPAAPVVRRILADGQAIANRHSEGYVPTPAALARRVCGPEFADLASLPAGARILEPSAGDGSLVREIRRAGRELDVLALEPDAARYETLLDTGASCRRTTLEEYAEQRPIRFDAVVMNPPFNITGADSIWIEHVTLAYGLLAPGARLVAIVPAGFTDRRGPRFRAVRALAADHGGFRPLTSTDFPGIGIGVGVLWLDKPPADDNRPTWLLRRYTGDEVPARVQQPQTSLGAGRAMPVQVRYDAWHGSDRLVRFAGRCMLCPRLVWGYADGDNDARGVFGLHTYCWPLLPDSHGMEGDPAVLCVECGNDGDLVDKALPVARRAWTPPAAEADTDDSVVDALPAATTHEAVPAAPRAVQLDLLDLIVDQLGPGSTNPRRRELPSDP
ncbi:hypothetical protein SAMN05421812_12519 [Asanoa hainanensis]|uniref:Methyltransferase small domain-containing protein n=1 Tax=Asanoa hainanensis TaxID=560556 RepID=A0A239PF01_9ACTN|nr:hypothetical protein [Asanoa hainanensis]SNT65676.1 hypothetical protein SAMN05421812_12519 [Asanoa hainanensis]